MNEQKNTERHQKARGDALLLDFFGLTERK